MDSTRNRLEPTPDKYDEAITSETKEFETIITNISIYDKTDLEELIQLYKGEYKLIQTDMEMRIEIIQKELDKRKWT